MSKKFKVKYMLVAIAVIAAVAAVAAGPLMSNVEQMPYKTSQTAAGLELREYPPLWVAQVRMQGARDEALTEGFKVLADYIFGNNSGTTSVAMTSPVTQQNIAMTAPVMQQSIAMTAPVTQQADAQNTWVVRFGMPAQYTSREQLPNPKDPRVELTQVPAQRFAVHTFSGIADTQALAAETTKLRALLTAQNYTITGEPVYAFFNPPWTLPFLRRNEVMLPVIAP